MEKSHFASDLGDGHSAWGKPSLHLPAPAPLPHSWNKAVLARRRNVFFPFFLRRFDFAKEWVRSLAVSLKSYSHHHWPSKAAILFFWEPAVVTNKPWSKRGHPCSHLTLQKSTHARAENTDTRDHTTPLPFQVDLLFALVSGKDSGNRFQYWAQKNSWFITHSANLAKLHKKVKAQKHPFCEHLMPSSSPQLF